MGKLSKRQRTVNLKFSAELEATKARLVNETKRARDAEFKLQLWHDQVAQFCSSSTLLPLKDKLKYINPHMRVMPPPDRTDLMGAWEHDVGASFKSLQTEELMMILQSEPMLREDMTRRLHFRITNAPGARGDFSFAYGVTRTAIEATRKDPSGFVNMIARELARGIWHEIYGEKK